MRKTEETSVMIQAYPVYEADRVDEKACEQMKAVKAIIDSVRNLSQRNETFALSEGTAPDGWSG